MHTAINSAKTAISNAYNNGYATYCNANYSRFWLFTNENIKGYLNTITINNAENALSVLASGDQAFNLIIKGINNIDTFDINQFTEYYALGLKRALILKYNYVEFINVVSKMLDSNATSSTIVGIINDLLPLMDKNYRDFWSEISDHYYKLDKNSHQKNNLFMLLGFNVCYLKNIQSRNNYLADENNYNILKQSLNKTNLTFTHANATDLPMIFAGKYDYLLLSNILDYIQKSWGGNWTMEDLNVYLKSLKCIMKDTGTIFLYYAFSPKKIQGTNLGVEDFKEKDILRIKDNYGLDSYLDNAVIIKKVREINE